MPLRPPHRAGLLLALPLALALAAYARVLPGEFVYDDEHAVVRNPDTRDLATAARAAWAAFRTGGRPVADLTFAANRALGGLDPRGYHAVNLGLHLLAVVLLYLLARRLLGLAGAARARWQALAVAGLWALHPLGSQAVSYVTQRAEVLASALMVAALLAFLGASAPSNLTRPFGNRISAAFIAYLCHHSVSTLAGTKHTTNAPLFNASSCAFFIHLPISRP